MIAMLFGTIPIAHKTGGLRDSIKEGYNGFLFSKYSSETLEEKVMQAIKMWENEKPTYEAMVEHALTTDFSWKKNAEEYLTLYKKILEDKMI
jgi:starch synthase